VQEQNTIQTDRQQAPRASTTKQSADGFQGQREQTTASRFWRRFWELAELAFAGSIVLSLGISAAAQNRGTEAGLKGTWVVLVQQRDCQTGVALGDPFRSLVTFANDGTMTETTSNPMFYPSERGPGHGLWSKAGDRKYRASSAAFVTTNGVLSSTQTITETIEMGNDPNHFQTTKAQVQFFNPDGTLLRSGCATAVGKRFQ
jgi:hypothetical protein